MNNKKKLITLGIGAALLLTIIPSSLGYAEEGVKGTKGDNINGLIEKLKIEKLESSKKDSIIPKTILRDEKIKEKKLITKNEASGISKSIAEKYLGIKIVNTMPIKTEEEDEGFETKISSDVNDEKRYSIKLDKYGEVLNIYTHIGEKEISKNHSIDVNKSKKVVNDFLEENAKDKLDHIEVILMKNSNQSDVLNYKLKRVYKGVEVIGEGGLISVDGENFNIVSYDMKWSNLSFEEEIMKKMNKIEAINILKESNAINPVYIDSGKGYVLDFVLNETNEGEEYVIDVKEKKMKNLLNNEYTVKEGIPKGIENLNSKPKSKDDVKEISINIIEKLTGKKGRSLPVKVVEESGKRFIRSIVATTDVERYYVEYDEKTFNVLNIYKYGYDTTKKEEFKAIDFNDAYKRAVTAIGLIYNKEFKNINLNQTEYDLVGNARVYSFKFKRIYKNIDVNDQYIAVNVDAITGEVLSVFLEWNSKSTFDSLGKREVEEKRDKYLKKLEGHYVYISENNIGKLYYILKDKK